MAARTRALLALLLVTAACADKPAPLPARLEPRALLEEWRSLSERAADAVAQAIEGQFPGSVVRRHAVRDVQVLNAKQQSLELELDGLGHKVLLSDTSPEAFRPLGLETAPRAPGALQEAVGPLVPPGDGGALGDLVLVGPLELVFSSSAAAAPGPEGALPSLPPLLPGGPGAGGRVVLGAGAAVSIAGVRGARLGRPLDLPAPAVGYLAGVWGRSVGEAKPTALGGLEGVLHLASGLRERAEAWQPLRNAAAGGGADAEKPQALVTLHLEVAARAAGLRAAAPAPGAAVAELMVRRGWNGTLELAVAGQENHERETGSKRGAKEEEKDAGALTKPWAWPLVNAEAPALARYEALARELVARHGLAGFKGLSSVRLLAASADALALLRFDMEVQHARAPNNSALPAGAFDLRPGTFERWQATVQVKAGEAGELQLVPVTAQRLEATHGSIAFSPLSQAMQLGNLTLPQDLEFVYPSLDAVY